MRVLPGFKCCLSCCEAVPLSDRHSKCICCLEESHISQKCSFCLALKCRAGKNREIKLRLLTMEHSMQRPSEPCQETQLPRRPPIHLFQDRPSAPAPLVYIWNFVHFTSKMLIFKCISFQNSWNFLFCGNFKILTFHSILEQKYFDILNYSHN